MPTSACPRPEELSDYLAGNLAPAHHDRLTNHIDGCAACRVCLDRLASIANSLHSDLRRPMPSDRFANEPERERALADGQAVDPGATMNLRTGPAGGRVIPARIGDYDVLEEIARGGMGVVYKARQTALGRLVAIKMILAGDYADLEDLGRFQVEAEAVARLRHPNIVQIFECGASEGKPYLALEYCDGGSLAAHLDGTPLPAAAAARLVEQLACAVAAAHHAGIVHRDLKPSNILLVACGLAPGSAARPQAAELVPKISDFGLAKKLEDASNKTRTGSILGTPSYMAPEQALGDVKRVGPAADIYALGAILYELLTGRPPFKGPSVLDTLEQVRTQEPLPLRVLQPRTPRDLEAIALHCLEKEPGRRYPSALALAEDLQRFAQRQPVSARPAGNTVRLARWCRRHPMVTMLLALLALSVGGGFVGVSWNWLQANQERDRADAKTQEALLQAYRAHIVAATAALEGHDVPEAARQLDAAAKPLRGWEWRHLDSRLDDSSAQLGPPEGGYLDLGQSPHGIRVLWSVGERLRVTDEDGRESLSLRPGLRQYSWASFRAQGMRYLFKDETASSSSWTKPAARCGP
jgi:serine/threonine protein kinase